MIESILKAIHVAAILPNPQVAYRSGKLHMSATTVMVLSLSGNRLLDTLRIIESPSSEA